MKTRVFKKEKIPDLNYKNYKVILIGVSNYPEDKKVKNVPNIKINIETLNSILTDKSVLGIPQKNVLVSLNKSKVEIEKDLSAFVKNTNEDDTIIVYYTGHGFISSTSFDLFLATADTQLDYIDSTGISIKRFRQIISQSMAKRKIIILDACHSGGVHNHLSDNRSLLTSVINKFEGEYVISSSSEDEPSLYPVGKKNQPTYFTGELVNVLATGIDNGNPYITMSEIFKKIFSSLKDKNLPLPQQSNNNNAGDIPIVKNILFNNELTEKNIQEIQNKYFQFANKSNTDIRISAKKNLIFNFATSLVVIIAFATFFGVEYNKKIAYAKSTTNSEYEIKNYRTHINLFYNDVVTEPLLIDNTDVNQLINKAKVFMNADGGYDIAKSTLLKVLSIDPDNTEAKNLLNSLESTQN